MSLEANAGKDVDKLLLTIPKQTKKEAPIAGKGIFGLLVPIKYVNSFVQKTSLAVRQRKIINLFQREIEMYDQELRSQGKCFLTVRKE